MSKKSKTLSLFAGLVIGFPAGLGAREGIPVDEGRDFWSFRPLSNPAKPEVANAAWPTAPLDHFVLARLEAAGQEPAPESDRRTLIRRLYFDLLGLPPSPSETQAFIADTSADAYEKRVDRLLESRHFGERWGRHWLDVARYSETTGGGRDMPLPNAWRYRDYVIASFNRDKPFDRFLSEQIAGDLLEHADARERRDGITGTGFLALGPSNYENQDKELLRMDVVDEQIDTVGRAFMGMTLGCARCHDHFFDPVPTRDYYALAGIFRSTKSLTHSNVSAWIKTPLPPVSDSELKAAKELKEWHTTQADLKAEVAKLEKIAKAEKGPASGGTKLAGIVVDDDKAQLVGKWVSSTSQPGFVGKRYIHDGASGPGEHRATFQLSLPKSGEYQVRVSYTASSNRATAASVTVQHAEGEDTQQLDQRERPTVAGFQPVGRYRFDAERPAVVTLAKAKPGRGHLIVDSVAFVPAEELGHLPEDTKDEEPAAEEKSAAAELKALKAKLSSHGKKKPKAGPIAMSVTEESEAADYAVNIGGNPHKLGDEVPRGFLQVLSAPGTAPPEIAEGQSGRLELARWLASAEHPLTARVYANRVWYWLTGRGIVPSVDNFGNTGEPPTHPGLLDHLAATLVQNGWSTKNLVREIVLSSTYRQATEDRPNSLYAGYPVRRLDVEAMRDAMLSASGELEMPEGPPPSDPKAREKKHLRSVYLPIGRNKLPDIFALFDFPDPNLSAGARSDSTLPTQALYMMNHPWVIDRSAAAAKRWSDLPGDLDAKIKAAYQHTVGRAPDATETALAREFLGGAPDDKSWTAFQQTLFASIAFRHIR